ncbi:MAG: transcription termination factor NusA, partial [Chloroflexota bacterium]
LYLEYADRAGEIVTGLVRNVDARSHNVAVGLGKAEAILPRNEQIPTERYRFNQRLRVYIVSVDRAGQGPQILVSRSHPELLRRLLELEVPEIFNGTVDVKGIAREPGARSKVAVLAMQAGVDPVGSCVGMRGVRIQNIVNELNGEKIDVVAWSPQVETFVANSLSPAKVTSVYLDAEGNTATVVVPDRSLSLAIGKEGQNARPAAKLTGWRIDIRSETEAAEEIERLAAKQAEAKQRAAEREAARRAAEALLAEAEASLAAEGELAIEEEVVAEVEPAVASVDEAAVVAEEAMAPEVAVVSAAEPEAAPEAKPAEETAPVEAAAPATELAPAVEETASTPAVAGEPAVETEGLEIESEEEEEEDSDGRPKDRTKKRRGQEMVYDERLGRVVARKKHKSGGRRGGWSGDDDEF